MASYSIGVVLLDVSSGGNPVVIADADVTTRDGVDRCDPVSRDYCGVWGVFPVPGSNGLGVASSIGSYGNNIVEYPGALGTEEPAFVLLQSQGVVWKK